jgi:cell division protein FtsL
MQPARKLSVQNSYGIKKHPARHLSYYPDPERRTKKIKLFSLGLACFLLSLTVVAQYSSLVLTNYRISAVRTELAARQETTRQLELEVSKLSAVSLIEEIAKTELGMVEPELSQLRIISTGRVLSASFGE